MMQRINWTVLTMLLGLSVPALAAGVDADSVIGGAIGGAAGAAVGSAVGGRDGAIVGGAIGGAAGVAIATDKKKKEPVREVVRVQKEREVVYVREEEHHDNGRHRGHRKHKHGHREHGHGGDD